MPRICFAFSDQIGQRLVAAYSERYPLDAIEGETRIQFARRMMIEEMRQKIIDHESAVAAGDAAAVAAADVDITLDET